jgi:hypothetical protein
MWDINTGVEVDTKESRLKHIVLRGERRSAHIMALGRLSIIAHVSSGSVQYAGVCQIFFSSKTSEGKLPLRNDRL